MAASRTAAAGAPDCLVAWRVAGATAGHGGAVLRCVDGDPACDADGIADGGCTVPVAVCLDVAADCAGTPVDAVRVRGKQAAPVARVLADVTYPVRQPMCSAEQGVRLPLGRRRRARTTLTVRAAGGGRADRDRLMLRCERAAPATGARAVVVTTDFETGRVATVRTDAGHAVAQLPQPIHADAVVRVLDGRVYVVNRFLADNIQVLDPTHGFRTVLQCSTGPGSNPHDIAVVGAHKAYVTRYNASDLWIVDPDAAGCDGFKRGTIDLSPWADGDGIPEMDQTAVVGDRLFVTVQRLDRGHQFAAVGKSLLLAIDTATDAVVGEVRLASANAFGDASGIGREPGTGKLLVNQAGDIFKTGDGGIQRVDPFTLTAEDFVMTEDELGGNVTDFVMVSPTKGYAVVITDALKNVLVAFDPSQRVVTRRLLTRVDYLPDIALAPDGALWVADRNLAAAGVRIFDSATDAQLAGPIDVGLPPFAIGFVP